MPGTSLQSVERAIQVLKSFDLDKPEWGVNELSREMGLHKSTVSRLMHTLEQGGLLSRDPDTDRYRLGVSLLGLAAQVVSFMDIRQIARPLLRQLAEDCQETVNLAVLDAGQIVDLEQFVPPARQVKTIGWVGRRMPPHCTAAGKVLLAYLNPHQLETILPTPLEKFTPTTLNTLEELGHELEHVRRQGYAIVNEELEKGLNAVAAPIFDHAGRVHSSISVAGPSYRVPPSQFENLAAHVSRTAAEISTLLGYRN